ncbi:MAG: acetylxylan esterase, partial [Woeseiaceae bacterium]|nr:acetylxylan esterase [Woeseiaceae bacterium]
MANEALVWELIVMKTERFLLLSSLFLIACISSSSGQTQSRLPSATSQWNVLGEEVDGVPVDQLLKNYLLKQLRPHFATRRAAIKEITTPQQFEARRQEIGDKLHRINGPFPKKTPLNARVVGRIDRAGYIIEKVIYESRPSHYVTANLYLPTESNEPVPGVLIPCGHSANGKAAEAYQSICISLARHGMAALIYDPISQGERHQVLDKNGKPATQGTTEHTLIGVGGLLVGTGTQNYRIWDGIRSLDYLISRPEVDGTRIGCTGNSGGGTMTSYLMAFDGRVTAAAPSCYLTTLERLFDTIGPQDAEQNFPGQAAVGLDHADFIHLRAPRPTLMCVATQDFFDNDGAWTTFREAKQLYSLLGHSERIDMIDFNDTHGFSKPRRTAAMRFMRRWLLGKDDNPEEGELTLCSDEELQCTATGEVLRDFADGVSVFDVTRKRAESLAPQREALWRGSKREALDTVRRLTGFRSSEEIPRVISKGRIPVDAAKHGWKGTIEKLVIEREGEVALPALLFKPERTESRRAPAVIYASSDGKASSMGPESECSRLAADGRLVLSIDIRGVGESRDQSGGRNGFFGSDFKTAFLSFHLNRPLLGQRVEDLQACLNYLISRDDVESKQVQLVGVGQCGPVALHLAALDERIGKVKLVRSIQSWMDVVAEPLAVEQLG